MPGPGRAERGGRLRGSAVPSASPGAGQPRCGLPRGAAGPGPPGAPPIIHKSVNFRYSRTLSVFLCALPQTGPRFGIPSMPSSPSCSSVTGGWPAGGCLSLCTELPVEITVAIASNPGAPQQPLVCFDVLRKSLLSGVSSLAQTKTWQRRLGCAKSAAGSWSRELGTKGGSCAGKIVVPFLFVVYSELEGSAGRWTAVNSSGLSPKMPMFKLLAES